MLPRVNQLNPTIPAYEKYLQALKTSEFAGDIERDYGRRQVYATDNSIYQLVPYAILFPKSSADISTALSLANQPEYAHIVFTGRGGGTSTNGQSLSQGIIIETSRYLNAIEQIDLEKQTVTVQTGLVLDKLNQALKQTDHFFAPTVSTSNRATIGGMISTDACGKGSVVYGKTSDHIIELDIILADGSSMTVNNCSPIPQNSKAQTSQEKIAQTVYACYAENRQLIEKNYRQYHRFLSGYNLNKLVADNCLRLSYLLAGSEGTLAFIARAKLKLTPIKPHKALIALSYSDYISSLSSAISLQQFKPLAIESMDDNVIALAKAHGIYEQLSALFDSEPSTEIRAVNVLELQANTESELKSNLKTITSNLSEDKQSHTSLIAYRTAESDEAYRAIWDIRKKCVGLLGLMPGKRKPVAFIEDTLVSPEQLPAYISELKSYLNSLEIPHAMYGHVDAGVLHVRPALDLSTTHDRNLLLSISDHVADLVKKHGGVLWGEHGKGFRSSYNKTFFDGELIALFSQIKQLFDPSNKLNPGKIAVPQASDSNLIPIDSPMRADSDKQINDHVHTEFAEIMRCNGNGECFDYSWDNVMCPSAKVSKDRLHSPNGRSNVIREWLRLLSQKGYYPSRNIANSPFLLLPFFYLWRLFHSCLKWFGVKDYSHQVYEAMNGCLACKACATQCPVHIDIPAVRAYFYYFYHQRYVRPLKDYAVALLEPSLKYAAIMPGLFNTIVSLKLSKFIAEKLIGIVDIPKLSRAALLKELKQKSTGVKPLKGITNLPEKEKQNSVMLIQDAFTSYFETELVLDVISLLQALGVNVHMAPFFANGKGLHIKGFLPEFKRLVQKNSLRLSELAECGVDMVGIDPAVTLTYEDEYQEFFSRAKDSYKINMLQSWLIEFLDKHPEKLAELDIKPPKAPYLFFPHCTEKTQHSDASAQWKRIFTAFGLELQEVKVGCCGMCGLYGHESSHAAESKQIFTKGWDKHFKIDDDAQARLVVEGYSCRSQVKRCKGFIPYHPAQVLLSHIQQRPLACLFSHQTPD